MVTPDTRNNLVVIIVIVAVALLVALFVTIFANSILQVADHGEKTISQVGKQLMNNISNATEVNKLNLVQFNKSMTDVIQSNYRIVASNNESIANLTSTVNTFSSNNTGYLTAVKNNTASNKLYLSAIFQQLKIANGHLKDISDKLTIVPVTPIPVPNPAQNKTCNIYSKDFPFCILPANHPIHNLTNHTSNNK